MKIISSGPGFGFSKITEAGIGTREMLSAINEKIDAVKFRKLRPQRNTVVGEIKSLNML